MKNNRHLRPLIQRVARSWINRGIDPRLNKKVTPTEFMINELHLPVSDDRFDRAMTLAARDMGGTYNRYTGIIHLPKDLVETGNLPFTELAVLYRKFPCGMLMKNLSSSSPVAGLPCVSFDVIPRVKGDPRRSKFYRSFQGEAGISKRLFNKFLAWLALLNRAIKRYRQQVESGRQVVFRVASPEAVAARWALQKSLEARSIRNLA